MNLKINSDLKGLIPPLQEDEYKTLEKSLVNEGCRDKILTWDDTIIDGHNRFEICTKNGIPFKTEDKDFENIEAVKVWMIDNQKGRRNLTDGWKWELAQVKRKLLQDKGKENLKTNIGDGQRLSINDKGNHNTQKEVAKELNWSTGKVAQAEQIWDKGDDDIKQKVKAGDLSIGGAYKVIKKGAHVSNNSGNNEWYTPIEYIDSARLVMGSIDLDPASSEDVNKKIQAEFIYTKETNGLKNKWYGNVWLNPPYEVGLVDEFVEKIYLQEFDQAVVLVNNATETKWGNALLSVSDCVCFHKSRIRFVSTDGETKNSPLQGQMIIYIGNNKKSFIDEFKKYGVCLSVEK